MKALLHCIPRDDQRYKGFERNIGARNVFNYIPRYTDHFSTLPDIDSHEDLGLDDYDVIAFSEMSFFDKDQARILHHNTSAKKIMVDWGDDFFIRRICLDNELDYYFKRELYHDIDTANSIYWTLRYGYGIYLYSMPKKMSLTRLNSPIGIAVDGRYGKVKPFPLICETDKFSGWKKPKKDYDLSFIMRLDMKIRSSVINELKKANYPKVSTLLSEGGMRVREYEKAIQRSKASISLRGYGFDTYRYWEIPYLGTMLISEKMPLVIPNNFIDSESAVFFDSIEDLKKKFEKYVLGSDEWKEIAKNGHRQVMEHHLPKTRVKNLLLDVIKD